MVTSATTNDTPPGNSWRWPRESALSQRVEDREIASALRALAEVRALGLPVGVIDNAELRRAVIDAPDDDAPRHVYAAWFSAQEHEFAQLLGAFIAAQLRVAQAFRCNRHVDVGTLRSWRGDTAYVSTAEFRAGDVLRPWFLDPLNSLGSEGLVGWPQIYRGFVERVGLDALSFLDIADELFRLAPIRHLVIIGVPEVVDELAACPQLARIRSLSLPQYSQRDALTDDALRRLIASPYLDNLAHLRLVHQDRVTPRAYEAVVTAPTLPRLSGFEVFMRLFGRDPMSFAPRRRAERMIGYDTTTSVMRSKAWIRPLERAIGYVPCLHPEDYYGRDFVDLEAVVEHPIALDTHIMTRLGMPVSGRRAAKASQP